MNDEPLGHSLGRRLTEIAAAGRVKAKHVTAPIEQAIKTQAMTGVMEHMESELRPVLSAMFADMKDVPDLPEHFKVLLERATEPEHQTDFLLQVIAVVAGAVFGGAALAPPMMQSSVNHLWSEHQSQPLSPVQAAEAVVRGIVEPGFEIVEGALSGFDNGRMGILEKLAGNPPGPMDLLTAWRRGVIDKERLEHGIKQGQLRNEWIDVIEALRFTPMSAASAVAAVVQSELSHKDGLEKATIDGLLPSDFDILVALNGRPPGPAQLDEAYNRGFIDDATWEKGVRETDIKNKYVDFLRKMRETLVPREALMIQMRHRVITDAEAMRGLLDLGYSTEHARRMVEAGVSEKTQTDKDLTGAEVLALYEERAISVEDAKTALDGLGFDPHETALKIALADIRHDARFKNAALSRFHSLFVGHRIDDQELSDNMDKLGIPPEQRNELRQLWALERGANAPDYTLAQLQSLWRTGWLTGAELTAALLQRGWQAADIDKLKALALPPSQRPGPKDLPKEWNT